MSVLPAVGPLAVVGPAESYRRHALSAGYFREQIKLAEQRGAAPEAVDALRHGLDERLAAMRVAAAQVEKCLGLSPEPARENP